MLDDKEPPQQQQRGLFDPALVHSVLINDCWTPLQIHSGCRTFRLSYQTSAANRWFIHHIKAIGKLYKSDRKKKSDRYQVWYPATISKINCIPSSIFDNSLTTHIFPVRRVMQPVRRFFQRDTAKMSQNCVAETDCLTERHQGGKGCLNYSHPDYTWPGYATSPPVLSMRQSGNSENFSCWNRFDRNHKVV